MKFRPAVARRIQEGRTTMHLERIDPADPHPPKPGRDYAVQNGRRRSDARIRMLDVRSAPLGALTFAEARGMGFRTRDEAWEDWKERYDSDDLTETVLFLRFELVDRVNLLHRDSSHGYTSNPRLALADEPEAVDPDTVHALGNGAALKREEEKAAKWANARRVIEQEIAELEADHELDPRQAKKLERLRRQLEGGDVAFAA